jgi:RimJ/RimL family protein N-acetyltransferase
VKLMIDPAGVSIRPIEMNDVPELYASVRESLAALHPWMPWCHDQYSLAESGEWVERQIAAFREKREFHFAIFCGQQFAGVCGLNAIQHTDRLANLGYWIRTSVCNRGIATSATRLLADWAFQNTELDRLEIVAAVGNIPSLRVAAKAGAVWEGVLRGRLRLDGKPHDAVLFSIMRGDR